MLTSKPPFQSSTTDEIYRRARERDYEWPTGDSSQKYISQEAKDLVATMLEDADCRPEPDTILQHPFFTSGYMPAEAELTSRLRELPPETQEFYVTRMNSVIQAAALRNLKDMCRQCCVGPWVEAKVIHSQIWKEMAQEEKAGLTPMIPLPENTVYRPFEDWLKEFGPQRSKFSNSVGSRPAGPLLVSSFSSSSKPLVEEAQKATGLLRQPPQSFAAQQRAQNKPALGSTAPRSDPISTDQVTISSANQASMATSSRRDAVREDTAPEGSMRSRRLPTRPILPSTRSAPSLQVAERAASLAPVSIESPTKASVQSVRTATLFSPTEKPEAISDSRPDVILDRLRRLQTELERALNARTMAIISSKTVTPPHPQVVVKWVDYTNKFGLGYILNDGSVGCVLRDMPTTEGSKTAMLPPAGVFIHGAERHILRRQDESYSDRNQPIPMTRPILFFENHGEGGLAEVNVSPEHFRVSINEEGAAGKMNPGKDIYQHRKRERIILWKKFANYMIAYGRDENLAAEDMGEQGVVAPGQKGTTAELVTFYQRFGDVGCWVFCDGHLQVSGRPG